ncbi:BamA/TamA family outer membrane protein [Candidatus Saganbacteria bacterium]|nr:BamA/TamA family outer membrane protein [Candidatus Saganbacteria bacterium]
MKKVWCLLFLLVLCVSAQAVEQDLTKFPVRIASFAVRGNHTIPQREILDAVFSKVGEALNEERIRNDLKAIYALGYFEDVTVDFEVVEGGTRVIYQVVENPVLTSLTIEGANAVPSSEISSLIKLKVGGLLNYKTLRDDLAAINDNYRKQGYTLARVVDVAVSPDKTQVDFMVVEGIVEEVSLEGNATTLDYVIRREMKTRVGSVFNEEVLAKDLRRVFNLGFFSEINPVFEPGSTTDRVRIILKIKETRTNTINFGGGWGEREGWFGFLDLSINNLMGTAQGLMLRGQTGTQLTTYQFKYTNPWFWPEKLGDKTSLAVRLWNTQGTDIYLTQQDQINTGWDATIGKSLRDEYSASYTLGTEAVSPRGGASFEAYNSAFIGTTLAYDTRDFWMNPTKGVYHTISLRQGWKFTTITTGYSKVGFDFNIYRPVGPQQVLASHLGMGLGMGDVPLGELYWAGGPNTVRGYGFDEIRRGTRKLLFNLEYRYTFNETFQGVVFFDWGDAWNGGEPDIKNFLTGWGPGLRLNTPLGPIRLDYGVGAGKNVGEGILHFSIGQAF